MLRCLMGEWCQNKRFHQNNRTFYSLIINFFEHLHIENLNLNTLNVAGLYSPGTDLWRHSTQRLTVVPYSSQTSKNHWCSKAVTVSATASTGTYTAYDTGSI